MAVIDIVIPESDRFYLIQRPRLYDATGPSYNLDHSVKFSTFTGYEERDRYCPDNRMAVSYTWDCVSAVARRTLLEFFTDHRGKWKWFWMPLWVEVFGLTSGVTSGSNAVWMQNCGYHTVFDNDMFQTYGKAPECLFIQLKNGDCYARPIISCTVSSVMFLEQAFPINIAFEDIAIATRMMRWHFASGMTERLVRNIILNDLSNGIYEISAVFKRRSGTDDGRGIEYY